MTQHTSSPRARRVLGRALLAGALAPALLAPPSWAAPVSGGVTLAQADQGGNAEELLRRQQRQQQGAPGQRQQRPQGEDGGAPQRGPQPNEGGRQRPPAPDARQGEPGGQPGRRPEPPAPRQPRLDSPRREAPPAPGQPRAGQPEPGAPAQAPRRQPQPPAEPDDAQAPRRTPEGPRPDAPPKPAAPRAAPAETPPPAAPQAPAQRQNRTPPPGQPPAPGEAAPAAPGTPAPRGQEPRPPAPGRAPDAQRPAGEATPRQQPPQPTPPAPQTQEAPARQGLAPQPGQPAPAGAQRPQAAPVAPAQPAPGQPAPAQVAPAQPPAPGGRRDGQIGDRNGQIDNRDGQIGNRDGRVGQDQVQGQPQERRRGLDPAAAAALGAAAGFAGGFVASQGVRGLDDVRQRREEFTDNGVTVIREPGRTIVQENGRTYLRHDETERFRDLGGDVRVERRGADQVTVYQRADGTEVVTVTDETGRLIRRTRRYPDGQEVVIIDNGWDRRPARLEEEVIDLPPPRLRIPRERYVVDAESADEETIYETLTAPEVDPVPQRYTLDQVRYSPDLRARMRSVDVDTITFETGSWEVDPAQASRLRVIADAVRRAVQRNPREVFLVEGHTDAVGSDVDNLSLSDRRAQSVAAVLTRDFGVTPENLTTQGYGEQYLKVQTDGPARENRRVTIRRITPLLNGPQTSQQ